MSLPIVSVPELPTDPTGYIKSISESGYFESVSFTSEDSVRNKMYQQNVERKDFENEFSDLSSFLKSLCMVSKTGEINQTKWKLINLLNIIVHGYWNL